MPADDVVAIYAPTLQRYLTGPLPETERHSCWGMTPLSPA